MSLEVIQEVYYQTKLISVGSEGVNMLMSIDFNEIKNSMVAYYQTASVKITEWTGRLVAVLKSGADTALPYLQDKRIAVLSLIAVNLIMIEVGNLFSKLFVSFLPGQTDGQKAFRKVCCITVGLGVVAAGVTAFAKYAKLPLNGFYITGISVVVIVLRAACTTPSAVKDEDDAPVDKAASPEV
jgi:hypothetical protein